MGTSHSTLPPSNDPPTHVNQSSSQLSHLPVRTPTDSSNMSNSTHHTTATATVTAESQHQAEEMMDTFMLPNTGRKTGNKQEDGTLPTNGKENSSWNMGEKGDDDDTHMRDRETQHEKPQAFYPTPMLTYSDPQEEHMSREDEEFEQQMYPNHTSNMWDDMQLQDPTTYVDITEEYVEEYDTTEEPQKPATPAVPLTRDERLALEEKQKQRKKFAEMRYLVNTMYRCRDCMLAPTDMELGFDPHAPPRRPAARPSAGPGSDYCCYGPALAEALPAEFPIDLVPLTHSYLLNESPSRSFLTTPPLPSQGTIQCYILKTNTKFELYLEMKNQETFVKMRQAKTERDQRRAARAAGLSGATSSATAMEGKDEAKDPNGDVEMKDEVEDAHEPSVSSHMPNVAPILVQSQSLPVMSLDDSELPQNSPRQQEDLPLETPADMGSPTHSLDYEKLFPERAPQRKLRRVVRSATNTPELKGLAGSSSAAAAYERFAAGPRRMSEPAIFNLGSRAMRSGASSTNSTPQSVGRRLSGANPAVAAAVSASLPPSESNLHLHNTRTNAINSMLKQHAENIIAEGKDVFLLCAQRKRSWTGNHYIISNDRDNIKAEGPSFYGKLKSNFGGTEFVCVDNGTKSPSRRSLEKLQTHQYPTKATMLGEMLPHKEPTTRNTMAQWLTGSSSQPHVRHELACVMYDHFFEHTGSPIRIKVLLPNRAFDLVAEAQVGGSIIKQYKAECERNEKRKLEAEAKAAAMEEVRKKSESAMTDVDQTPTHLETSTASSSVGSSAAVAPAMGEVTTDPNDDCSIDQYENLRPVWHDGMNAYVLHFDHHRVREKSVKNFILKRTIPDPASKTPGATTTQTILQFGRVLDRNVFVMDFGYPLSPLAAFAICLSSIDPKLAV